jgi:hypothetical protein
VTGAWLSRWRARLLRPLLGLLLANAVLALVYTLPRTLQERSLSEHAASLANDVERERRQLARKKERAETLAANARDLEAFYGQVLEERGQLVSVLKELDRLAPSAGSRTFHPSDVKGSPVSRFAVSMPLSGSYEQLVGFLRKLEHSRHFVIVERIRLREGQSTAHLDVELSVYFRGEKG